jgi:hypothetical protein
MFKLSHTTKKSIVTAPDGYYVIYGYSELRIRSGDGVVFSNLGIVNSYFNYREIEKNVNDLIGGGKQKNSKGDLEFVREVEIDSYEFHQVHFE